MAATSRSTKGMGQYKSPDHQRKGGGKQVVDPQSGVGTVRDQYKGGK